MLTLFANEKRVTFSVAKKSLSVCFVVVIALKQQFGSGIKLEIDGGSFKAVPKFRIWFVAY